MRRIARHVFKITIYLIVITLITHTLGYGGRDDTDSKVTNDRSGMRLYTDYGTGCQYLRAGMLSSMIPRLDSNGDHVCINK